VGNEVGEGGRRGEVGRREVGRENFGAEKGAEKSLGREEDVFLVHPENGLSGLILNWCTDGCWFTPAQRPWGQTPSCP
jgi:hypothetical protein